MILRDLPIVFTCIHHLQVANQLRTKEANLRDHFRQWFWPVTHSRGGLWWCFVHSIYQSTQGHDAERPAMRLFHVVEELTDIAVQTLSMWYKMAALFFLSRYKCKCSCLQSGYSCEFSRLCILHLWYWNTLISDLISSGENSAHFLQLGPTTTILHFFRSTGYPLLLVGQRQYGMRSLPDTSTHDQR